MSTVITPTKPLKKPRIAPSDAPEKIVNDILANGRVIIPDIQEKWFSARKLWAFTGPGFLMSIAYLDPGNIESDLRSGATAKFKLIWVLLMAHLLGLFLQRLAARIGTVSGMHMAEVAHEYYAKVPRVLLWIMVEIAIIGSDMQEVIGTAVAIYLLSNGLIPLWAGVLITILDTFTFMFLDKYGIRKFEFFFCFLISVMAATFGYEFYKSHPDSKEVALGTLVPWCSGCGTDEFLMAVSVIGAVIMPHNLYLHSALVKSRAIDRGVKRKLVEANKYFFIESSIALFCSFVINLLVVSVFGSGFYGHTNEDIQKYCLDEGNKMPSLYLDVFPNNTEPATSDIYHGGVLLGCKFGVAALYVWAIGILAAGQSATMTGTYSGQFVMEGFIQLRMERWKRILITRSIAIFPTILVTVFSNGVEHLTGMNDLLNCMQMLQLPFALIPVLTFVSNKKIMREFACSVPQRIGALCLSVLVVGINTFFLFEYIKEQFGLEWYSITFFVVLEMIYTSLAVYFSYYCVVSMGLMTPLNNKVFPPPKFEQFDAPWTVEKSYSTFEIACA